MDIRFDPKNSKLYAGERLRYTKNDLFKETMKPFFLIRFFRWIRGQYNHTTIHDKINRIALNMLSYPEQSTLPEWQQFKQNFQIINRDYRNTDNRRFSELLYYRITNKLYDIMHRPAAQAQAPADPTTPNEKAKPSPGLGRDYIMDDNGNYYFMNRAANDQKVEINPDLKQRWHDAILLADADEDEEEITPLDEGWEDQPINSEGPFVEILSTPKGLIELVAPPMTYKIKKKATEGNTVATISELLKALGISTPKACMQNGIEPKLDSLKEYFKKNEASFIETLKKLGYIKQID